MRQLGEKMEFQLLKYKKRINKNIYKQKALLNKLN